MLPLKIYVFSELGSQGQFRSTSDLEQQTKDQNPETMLTPFRGGECHRAEHGDLRGSVTESGGQVLVTEGKGGREEEPKGLQYSPPHLLVENSSALSWASGCLTP